MSRCRCVTTGAEFHGDTAHKVKFLMDDIYVVSASGKDTMLVRGKIK